jgi:polyisoprenoid-binding protein YceI
MSFGSVMRNKKTWFIGIPVLLVLIFVGGPFVYINFIKEDAPARLEFETVDSTRPSSTSAPAAAGGIAGEWSVASGSTVGYRAEEILFGQSTEGAGRTSDITGTMTITGTTVESADFTADLRTLESDSDNRDSQVQDRILETSQFPEASLVLTEPIELASVPDDLVEITEQATADLTIHGVTKPVTFELKARRNGDTIEVNGSIPITWSDYEIDSPSGGPAQVADDGEMEFLITFTR